MLVNQWNALYDAVPVLQAEEALDALAVAQTAQPASDSTGLSYKQRQIDRWRSTIQRYMRRVRSAAREVSLSQLAGLLRGAFHEQVRE